MIRKHKGGKGSIEVNNQCLTQRGIHTPRAFPCSVFDVLLIVHVFS